MTAQEIAATEKIARYMHNGVIPKYNPIMKYFDGERVPYTIPNYTKSLDALAPVVKKVIYDFVKLKKAGIAEYEQEEFDDEIEALYKACRFSWANDNPASVVFPALTAAIDFINSKKEGI